MHTQASSLLRTKSHILSEQFSINVTVAREQLNRYNNDESLAGKALLQMKLQRARQQPDSIPIHWILRDHNEQAEANIDQQTVSWEYAKPKLWVRFDRDASVRLETMYANKEDGLVLENCNAYIDFRQMTATDETGHRFTIRRVSNPSKIRLAHINNNATTVANLECINVSAMDKQRNRLITSHVRGYLQHWKINKAKGTVTAHSKTKLGPNQTVLTMDVSEHWAVYALQYNRFVRIFLQSTSTMAVAPFFIAQAPEHMFGGSCTLMMGSKESRVPPSIVVGLVGGFQLIQYVMPHLWNKAKGNPTQAWENWQSKATVTVGMTTNPNDTVSDLHVIDHVVLATACSSVINFFCLCPGPSHGKHVLRFSLASVGNVSKIIGIRHYKRRQARNVYCLVVATQAGTIQTFQAVIDETHATLAVTPFNTYVTSELPCVHSFAVCGNPPSHGQPVLALATVEGKTFVKLNRDTKEGNGGTCSATMPQPLSWLEKKAATNDLIVLVPSDTMEFMGVANEYDQAYVQQQTQRKSKLHIKNVYRIQNKRLWRRYTSFVNQATGTGQSTASTTTSGGARLDPLFPSEKRLFHGTSAHVIDAVLTQGFDFRLAGVNGTVHGAGVNFAKRSSYSLSYVNKGRASRRNRIGRNVNQDNVVDPSLCCMFMARVYVGRMAKSVGNARRPPPIDPQQPHGALYDSTVDCLRNSNVHVIYDNHQAYPEYLIELNSGVVNGGGGSFGGFGGFGGGGGGGGARNSAFGGGFSFGAPVGATGMGSGGGRINASAGGFSFGATGMGGGGGRINASAGGFNFGSCRHNRIMSVDQHAHTTSWSSPTQLEIVSTHAASTNTEASHLMYVCDNVDENDDGSSGGVLIDCGKNEIHAQRIDTCTL